MPGIFFGNKKGKKKILFAKNIKNTKKVVQKMQRLEKLKLELENAKTIEHFICLLLKLTGYELLPQVLFNANYELKSFKEIVELTQHQIIQIENSFLLTTNLNQSLEKQWKTTEVPFKSKDMEWFISEFGFTPTSIQEIRIFLLNQHSRNLHWFVNSKGEVWENMLMLIACIRKEISNAHQKTTI